MPTVFSAIEAVVLVILGVPAGGELDELSCEFQVESAKISRACSLGIGTEGATIDNIPGVVIG